LIAASNTLWISDIAKLLKEAYPNAKLPTREMANWLVKIVGIFDQSVKSIVPDVGTFHEADASYVTNLTGVMPRPAKDAVLAAAQSLIENNQISLD